MNRKSILSMIGSLLCCLLVSLGFTSTAHADTIPGTERLGPASIPIAQGSQILLGGVGLEHAQPGIITIDIPANVDIAQVLLYWTGRAKDDPGDDDTIQVSVDSVEFDVTGIRIGGPDGGIPSSTYRADITGLGLIEVDQSNELSIGGLDFIYRNNGAALAVILDDGTRADIQILDGNDFAYEPKGYETEQVTFPIAPSALPQVGKISMMVSDVGNVNGVMRPAAVEIVVGGITNLIYDALLDNEGDSMDVVELPVTVPPWVSSVSVRALSIDDGTLQPASLTWSFVAWQLALPVEGGCTYTIGYWKNHSENWPTDTLSLFTGDEAMDTLWMPPKGGNAFLILAHQYIGAELNMRNGASIPLEVLDALANGHALLFKYLDAGAIPKNADDRNLAIAIAGVLDAYNNGLLGPGHCDDKDPCVKEDPCVEEEPCVKQQEVYVKKDVKTKTKRKSKK